MSESSSSRPLVGICMGSKSDLPTMRAAGDTLRSFSIPFEMRILSAHRTPQAMVTYALGAADAGVEVLIAGAGGAAHLPGMIAALTSLPVIGVPVPIGHLNGLDALLSIVQMPKGTPVATVAIGNAANAAHLAVRMLATTRPELRRELKQRHEAQAASVRADDEAVAAAEGSIAASRPLHQT